jgi:pimeloyl-ACP methyl ester carboxylesterase
LFGRNDDGFQKLDVIAGHGRQHIAGASSQEKTKVLTKIEKRTCLAPDEVKIVYSAAGAGEPALVFIHGGLADRTFWDAQLKTFADYHRVLALDLAGHGESGTNRQKWGLPEFGADVRAVVEAEKPKRVVIIGNSLGGPVAIEAALLLPDAPIAEFADLLVVGDLFEVGRALLVALRGRTG